MKSKIRRFAIVLGVFLLCAGFHEKAVYTVIHNIELRPGQGALLVRSAGNFAQLTSREI